MAVKLKTIFENEWEEFKRASDSDELKRAAVHDNIWKMLHCKALWLGLIVYQCEDHGEEVRLVPCTCKSRFCPSCGYKANLIWLNQLLARSLPCDHQHLVFTLAFELRELAENNRRAIFNLMSRTLWAAIKQFINKHKGLAYQPGAVCILHTFGKGLKWHVHFHIMITAGGLRNGRWVENSYLNENYLKRAWKAKMLAGLRKLYRSGQLKDAVGRHPGQSLEQMLTEIYDRSWYVWIDRVRGDGTFAFIYLGRYCKRACVSQKGIIEYRPGQLVVWKERSKVPMPDHCAYRATPRDFIDLLIHHIPNRYEHQVHYFGLYSSRQKNSLYVKALKILNRKAAVKKLGKKLKFTWQKLMRWVHGLNPLACSKCGKDMKQVCILFFNPKCLADRDLLLNYEIKDYQLVPRKIEGLVAKSFDSS